MTTSPHDPFFLSFTDPDPTQFVVEGRWCVEALLENDAFGVVRVAKAAESPDDAIEKRCRDRNIELRILSKEEISTVAGYPFHRGVLALAQRPELPSVFESPPWPAGLLVCCPELADPSNLGSVARSAAALGAAGLIVATDRGADLFSRKSIRASSGAVFRIPLFLLPASQIRQAVADLRDQEYQVFGAVLGPDSLPLRDIQPPRDAILVLGPEKDGLDEEWAGLCDALVSIPMARGVDSLNVSACAAILIHHFVNFRPTTRTENIKI